MVRSLLLLSALLLTVLGRQDSTLDREPDDYVVIDYQAQTKRHTVSQRTGSPFWIRYSAEYDQQCQFTFPQWSTDSATNSNYGVGALSPLSLLSDLTFPLYLPSSTVVISLKQGSPAAKKYVVNQLETDTAVTDLPNLLAAGQGPSSSSTAPGTSIAATYILQEYSFSYEMWNGAKDYVYHRPIFGYLVVYEPSATVGKTIVRLIKVGETVNTFIGEYELPIPCQRISGKNQKLVCSNLQGYTIFSFTDTSPGPSLDVVRQVLKPMASPPEVCMVSESEILFVDSSNKMSVEINGQVGTTMGTIATFPNYVLRSMNDGCFYAGTIDGNNEILAYYGSKYAETNGDVSHFRNSLNLPIGSPFDVTMIDGIYFYHAQQKFIMMYINQHGVYTHKTTPEVTYVPLKYETTTAPAVKTFPVFASMSDLSRIQVLGVSGMTGAFSGLSTTPLGLDCYLPNMISGEMSQDFSFRDGQARNPRFSTEAELLVIVKYPGATYSYGESDINIAKYLSIVLTAVSYVCLSILLGYKTFTLRRLNKVAPPKA